MRGRLGVFPGDVIRTHRDRERRRHGVCAKGLWAVVLRSNFAAAQETEDSKRCCDVPFWNLAHLFVPSGVLETFGDAVVADVLSATRTRIPVTRESEGLTTTRSEALTPSSTSKTAPKSRPRCT